MTRVARTEWPREVVGAVMVQSRRRCAYCFGLRGDVRVKTGQIAHIDRDATNSTLENAAWLCLKHHSQYDTTSRQAKGHTPEELRSYQAQLFHYVTTSQSLGRLEGRHRRHSGVVSLEVFDRRLPIYRATVAFLREVLKLNQIDQREMFKFAAATDEALFLFDAKVADYLAELYKQGLRLRAIGLMLEAPDRRTRELIDEQTRLALWFTDQFDEVRRRLAPHLRLA